eukprot:1747841-Rhodomonas_salina.2
MVDGDLGALIVNLAVQRYGHAFGHLDRGYVSDVVQPEVADVGVHRHAEAPVLGVLVHEHRRRHDLASQIRLLPVSCLRIARLVVNEYNKLHEQQDRRNPTKQEDERLALAKHDHPQ